MTNAEREWGLKLLHKKGSRQNPVVFRVLKGMTIGNTILGLLSFLLSFFAHIVYEWDAPYAWASFRTFHTTYPFWIACSVFLFLFQVFLILIFPDYFSIVFGSHYKNSKSQENILFAESGYSLIGVLLPLFATGVWPTLTSFELHFLSFQSFFFKGLLLNLILSVLFVWRLKDFPRHRIMWILGCWLLLYPVGTGIPGQVNAILDSKEPVQETVKVVSMESKNGRYSYRKITVERADGTSLEIEVPDIRYQRTIIGHYYPLIIQQGFLDIPYAWLNPWT